VDRRELDWEDMEEFDSTRIRPAFDTLSSSASPPFLFPLWLTFFSPFLSHLRLSLLPRLEIFLRNQRGRQREFRDMAENKASIFSSRFSLTSPPPPSSFLSDAVSLFLLFSLLHFAHSLDNTVGVHGGWENGRMKKWIPGLPLSSYSFFLSPPVEDFFLPLFFLLFPASCRQRRRHCQG